MKPSQSATAGRPRTSPRRSSATRRRPSARSRTPFGLRRCAGRSRRASRPDVEPEPAVGQGRRTGVTCDLGVRGERGRRDDVAAAGRRRTRTGFSARTSSAIFPPISTSSARPPRFSSTRDLVLDLRAARDDHERALDLAEQRSEMLELVEQQQPGVGRQQLARRRRSTSARGAPSRTRRSRRGRSRPRARARSPGRSSSRPRLKRVFSSTRTRSSPSSSASRARTGSIENLARSSSVFGRPRCEQTRTSRAPRSSSRRSVGSDARIRVSSATRPSSSGTFEIRRGRARPCRRRRPPRPSAAALTSSLRDEIDQPARVAPLVVVPAEDLRRRAVRHRQLAVERARRGRVDDRRRDERLGRVVEVRRERPARRGRRERALIASTGRLRAKLDDEVGDRAGRQPEHAPRCRRPCPSGAAGRDRSHGRRRSRSG